MNGHAGDGAGDVVEPHPAAQSGRRERQAGRGAPRAAARPGCPRRTPRRPRVELLAGATPQLGDRDVVAARRA
jgi:hypothetical protein